MKSGLYTNTLENSSVVYKIADYLIKNSIDKNETFEVDGFIMKKGRTTRYSILTGMLNDPSITHLIKHEVKSGMKVFDVGSNIGETTCLFSKQVGNSGHVYAFEPDPSLFKILKENIKLNNLQNVSLYPLAISDQKSIGSLCINKIQDGDNRLNSKTMDSNSVKVEIITIDDFCTDNNILPDFIKLDIQGSEPNALRGMKQIVLKNPNIKLLTEFYPSAITDIGSSPKFFLEKLQEMGFLIKQVTKNKNKLQSASTEKLLKLEGNNYVDLFCFIPLDKS